MKNKKIIFIASYAESLINFRLHMIKEFLQRNYSVIAIAPYDENTVYKLAQIGVGFISIPLHRNGRNPLKDIWLLVKLFLLLLKEKPDMIFSYTIKPVIYGSIMAKFSGVKNIYSMITGTGYIFSNTNFASRFVSFLAKKMFRYALHYNKKIFFQNKDNVAFFIAHKLIKKNQPIAVINGSGVDINFFTSTPFPKNISFLMIARLLTDKGVREYVQAARSVREYYPEVAFRLVGWIDTNPNAITQDELSGWINEGVIEYLGKLSDVRSAISNASVYVLPSYGEGTPRTVLEAMAMGRPIITTNVPGCRETVINGVNGFLVQVKDELSLRLAMEYFIKSQDQIKKMGGASREIAVKKYDVNKVNECILKEMDVHYEIDANPTAMSVTKQRL